MASVISSPLVGGPLRPLRPLHPSCTRSVSVLGLAPLRFLFFVFPSRPLPLTPPGRVLSGSSKTLGPGSATPPPVSQVDAMATPVSPRLLRVRFYRWIQQEVCFDLLDQALRLRDRPIEPVGNRLNHSTRCTVVCVCKARCSSSRMPTLALVDRPSRFSSPRLLL